MDRKTFANIVKVVKAYNASSRGGLVMYIPNEIRRLLGVKAGDKFLVLVEGDSITYRLLKSGFTKIHESEKVAQHEYSLGDKKSGRGGRPGRLDEANEHARPPQ